jgi:hypothetical protein
MDRFVRAIAFEGVCYGLTTDGDVYKFWFGHDGWMPLIERCVPGSAPYEVNRLLREPERT